MFGLSGEKLFILALIAVFVLGPDRLPVYARKLAEWTKAVRRFADNTKTQLEDELGENFDDLDWRKLDPRQYDPRRIIREALADTDDVVAPAAVTSAALATGSSVKKIEPLAAGEAAPFDNEAT